LIRADLSNLVRRQFACKIDDTMVPTQQFSELFISIQDLRETLMPDVNLLANRWLFQHLTETLDRRMLSMLSKTDRIAITGDISFNINIRTLMSNEFLAFDDNVAANRRGAMIIELQKEDIFADLGSYLFVREFVQSKGYRVAIDGMTLEAMQLIDHKRLGANMVKLVWNGELVDGGENVQAQVRQMIESIGGENVVMCRCDNREAIDFGKSVGIQLYQGRYIENLLAEDDRRLDLLRLKRRIERSDEAPEDEDDFEEKDDADFDFGLDDD
ncbi:MAG: EAL domain-containing protein, partial [Rhodospirillales bacterium]|nr:EAL domain-containing protein [Rhodospirillales bacterium]